MSKKLKTVAVEMNPAEIRAIGEPIIALLNQLQRDGWTLDQVLAAFGYCFGVGLAQRGVVLLSQMTVGTAMKPVLFGYRTARENAAAAKQAGPSLQ